MSDLIKPPGPNDGGIDLTKKDKVKFGVSKLHQRLAKSQSAPTPQDDPLMKPNRLGIMLDISGSMASREDNTKPKIEHLKDAMQGFLSSCNPADTSVAVETFPSVSDSESVSSYAFNSNGASLPLTTSNSPVVMLTIIGLQSNGGTPMAPAMRRMAENNSITRGILLSDGEADYPRHAKDVARQYFASQEIPIDCVHIGGSRDGEELLKEIAEITGGLYIKFDRVDNFAKNFKYLTPGMRHLMLGAGAAGLLGAKEVK